MSTINMNHSGRSLPQSNQWHERIFVSQFSRSRLLANNRKGNRKREEAVALMLILNIWNFKSTPNINSFRTGILLGFFPHERENWRRKTAIRQRWKFLASTTNKFGPVRRHLYINDLLELKFQHFSCPSSDPRLFLHVENFPASFRASEGTGGENRR